MRSLYACGRMRPWDGARSSPGSRGIGLAIARMLAEEDFAITLASRSRSGWRDAAASLDAFAITADVSREEDCDRLVAQHVERHGGLDVLVNSAGIGIGGNIEALPVKHIDLQLGVNLRGLVLVTRAAIPHLQQSRGLIVNLASIAGTMPTPGLSIYGATKAAVISFTHSLNGELKRTACARPPSARGSSTPTWRNGAASRARR